jgi:type II secretory ATPase GspE/PulE/Tfp pilus assembly ATPase PilB-like protein
LTSRGWLSPAFAPTEQQLPTREQLKFLNLGTPHAPREEIHLAERDGYTQFLTGGRGFDNCRDTGDRGRVGVFELLMVDGPMK